jgi:structural maintenance of chromosome 4
MIHGFLIHGDFRELDQLSERLPRLAGQIRENEARHQNQRREEHEMQEKVNTLQREIEAGRREASSNLSNNEALNSLMEEKRSGRIRGILGRLGDLGGIDPRYDVAISTCCGQLDNVVVDTVESAQECIAFLHQNNLARMTFIALNKQNHFWDNITKKPQT